MEEINIKLNEGEFGEVWMALQHHCRGLSKTVRQKFRLGEYAPKPEPNELEGD